LSLSRDRAILSPVRTLQLRPYVVALGLAAACSSGKGKSLLPGGGVNPGQEPASVVSCGVSADSAGSLAAGDGSTLVPDPTHTLQLTGSGDNAPYLPPIADAQAPAEPLTPALTVMAPNGQCPHLMTRVSPAVAIPYNSSIRALEGYWNGTRLPLDPVHGGPDSELLEEAHNFGPQQMPFNTPLFSLANLPAGKGTLEIRAYDASNKEVAAYSIPNLEIVTPPAPVATTTIAGRAHPRFLLTADRLAHAQAKLAAKDTQATRYTNVLNRFLKALATNPDPTSSAFGNAIYNPSAYIPMLGVCYQLNKTSDPATAKKCSDAARALALQIANDYNGPDAATKFARDTGYDIRDGEPMMLLALDWIHDALSDADRQLIVKVATAWVDWYTTDEGAYSKSRPINNYFSPYIQALMLTGIVTAGENDAADRELMTLREKLTRIEPVANQRACGGDWPEGGNYGPNALRAHMMVYFGMLDIGEDWSTAFDFVQPLGLTFRYAITNDYTTMVPFGGFSGLLPHKTSPALLAMLTGSTAAGDHAATLYNLAQAVKNDFGDPSDGDTVYELLLGDVGKHADTSGLPLACLSPGSGRFFSKSSLDDTNGYLVTAEDMHYIFDHFGYANGDLRFYHGSTCILCASTYRGGAFNGEGVTPSFSTYQANSKVQAIDRNNQIFLTRENKDFAAIGMRFESSFVSDRFDESIWDPADPLDYLIREAVHVRPDVLVVRDLHRRRHAADTLVGRFHLGPTAAPTNASATQWQVGNVTVSMSASLMPTVTFVDDKDQSGTLVGKQLLQTFPSSTDPVEVVDVFSDAGVTLVSYSGGVAKLSNGKCVTFAKGDISVGSCS
jgi:hypothetical protein